MKNQKPNIEIFTEKAKLEACKSQTVDVLVRITPPAIDQTASKRPRLNLSMVLDRSGSMQGEKIQEAREAAKYCIDQLLATDRISTVIFDDQIDVLIPSQPVENKEILKRAINSVQANGSTALHEAWVRGGLEVSGHLDNDAINRVLLITDGQANVGETHVDRIVSQAQQLAAKGVSTSTIGIGRDFNEDLLMPMAEAGQGNAWHVQEPQDMVKIFERELKGLVSQIGHSVTLGIKTANGVTVADVLNEFESAGPDIYKLPNLQAGSPLEIVVRLRVPSHEEGSTAEITKFELAYTGQESRQLETLLISYNASFAPTSTVEQLSRDPHVLQMVQLLNNARARREAMERMDRRDYSGAQELLRSVSAASKDLFSIAPSAEIAAELDDLTRLRSVLSDRSNDVLARKQMLYRSESLRKSK
ncbi:MAG: VWA domain-containing protein [Pyrinomonadaceae bacterium]